MGRHSDYTASPSDQSQQNLHRVGYTVNTFADLASITTGQEFMAALVRDTGLVYYQDASGGWNVWNGAGGGGDWQESVLSRTNTPPVSPTTGDRYIITAVATGDWTGHENDITQWSGSNWVFVTPNEGFALTVEDENKVYYFNGSAWVVFYQTPLTTKGDIFVFSTQPDRLPVGANNRVLVADSAQATGMKWVLVDLTSMVTGILPTANGGSGSAIFQAVESVQFKYGFLGGV